MDAQRQLALLVAPDAIDQELAQLSDASPYLPRLREVLIWSVHSDATSCLLSLHLTDTFYAELRVCGPSGLESPTITQQLRKRLVQIPDRIEMLFAQMYPPVYWRRVALRVPEMARFLVRYARVGVEDGQVIANVVLPAQAAHNLIFSAEMLLSGGSEAAPAPAAAATAKVAPAGPQSIDELLEQKMNLKFDQKSLEFAIQDLTVDIRDGNPGLPFPFDIKILGTDLQLNGITRNQQITDFTAENQTIAEILTAMVMRANPVTTVTTASEPDQKLVWLLGPDPDDPVKRIVLITTRDAALRKDYKLPAVFQAM